MVIVSGIIGTATALWLYYNFVSWLGFLNATLPPVGAIIILDYILRRDAYKKESDDKLRKVNWFALLGVIVGAIVGNFVPWGISAINAMVAAGLVYFIGSKLFYKKQ